MTLKPGTRNPDGSNTAWSFVGADDTPVKQFFVAYGPTTPITLDITMALGARLTKEELGQVHDEVQDRNSGHEVAWPHHEVRP